MESWNGNGNGRVGRVDVCVNRYFQQVQEFIDGGSDYGIVDRDVRQISQWVSLGSYFCSFE